MEESIVQLASNNTLNREDHQKRQSKPNSATNATTTNATTNNGTSLNNSPLFIDLLTQEFLTKNFNHEAAAETQAYLVERVLPPLIIGLQRLLITVRSRKLLDGDDSGDNNSGGDVDNVHSVGYETPRVPESKFNPLNWLAQFLYRNNPTKLLALPAPPPSSSSTENALETSTTSSATSSAAATRAIASSFSNVFSESEKSYLKSLQTVSNALRDKVNETARMRRQKIETIKAVREQERERRRLERALAEQKRIANVKAGIKESYDFVIASLWRTLKPFLQLHNLEVVFQGCQDRIKGTSHHLENILHSAIGKFSSSLEQQPGSNMVTTTDIHQELFQKVMWDLFHGISEQDFQTFLNAWKQSASDLASKNLLLLAQSLVVPGFRIEGGDDSVLQVFSTIDELKLKLRELDKGDFPALLLDFINTHDPLHYQRAFGQSEQGQVQQQEKTSLEDNESAINEITQNNVAEVMSDEARSIHQLKVLEEEWKSFLLHYAGQLGNSECEQLVALICHRLLGPGPFHSKLEDCSRAYNSFMSELERREDERLKRIAAEVLAKSSGSPESEQERLLKEAAEREAAERSSALTMEQERLWRLDSLNLIFTRLLELINLGAIKSTLNGSLKMLFKNANQAGGVASLINNKAASASVWQTLSQIDLPEAPEDKTLHPSFLQELANSMSQVDPSLGVPLTVLAELGHADFADLYSDLLNYLQATEAFYQAVQERIRNRREMEAKCMNEIAALAKRVDLPVTRLCELTIASLERFFRNYYATYSCYISLLEHGEGNTAANTIAGAAKMTPSGALNLGGGNSSRPTSATAISNLLNARLRFVACSIKDRPFLLNRVIHPGEGLSFTILQERVPRFVSNVRDPTSGLRLYGLTMEERTKSEGEFTKRGSYFGVPLICNDNEGVGILAMDNIDIYESSGNVEVFREEDLVIAKNAGQKLGECLDKLDKRAKLTNLAINAIKWANTTIDLDLDFYLVENDSLIQEDGQRRNVTLMWLLIPNGNNAAVGDTGSSVVFEPVSTESYEKLYLWQCVDSKSKVIDKTAAYGKGAVAFPLIQSGHVVGLFSVRNGRSSEEMAALKERDRDLKETDGILAPDQTRDFSDVLSVLSGAVAAIKQQSFGQMGKTLLVAEKLDEQARVSMHFPRLMLQSIRENIGKMDSAAIAEIKSYRKPPPVIHRIMKCVLYIFGKKRKQLLRWVDVSKLLNADLLKSMTEYDPTSIQKRKKFAMVDRELRKIVRSDVRKQGSKPAKDMFDWLIIVLQLRKEAVAARKRLKEAAAAAAGSPAGAAAANAGNDQQLLAAAGGVLPPPVGVTASALELGGDPDELENDSDDPDELEPGMEEEI